MSSSLWNIKHRMTIGSDGNPTFHAPDWIKFDAPINASSLTTVNNLTVQDVSTGGRYTRYRNLHTGYLDTDGFDVGITTDRVARLWNYEATNIEIGTNNTLAVSVASSGAATFSADVRINGATTIDENTAINMEHTRGGTDANITHHYRGATFNTYVGVTDSGLFAVGSDPNLSGLSKFSIDPDTGNVNFSGNIQVAKKMTVEGGAKISVQNKVDGGSVYGIFFWDTDDTNYGAYMAQAGAGRSLVVGNAVAPLDGRTSYHIRHRVNGTPTQGFLWENNLEQCLMSLTADTGKLYVRGMYYGDSGSAALPVYSFTSDPDTGMFKAAANQLGFTTGGATQLVVGSDGTADFQGNNLTNIGNVSSVGTVTAATITANELISLTPQTAEPATPADGMIVYADGTTWNPGAGAGVYARVAGAWAKMS